MYYIFHTNYIINYLKIISSSKFSLYSSTRTCQSWLQNNPSLNVINVIITELRFLNLLH